MKRTRKERGDHGSIIVVWKSENLCLLMFTFKEKMKNYFLRKFYISIAVKLYFLLR